MSRKLNRAVLAGLASAGVIGAFGAGSSSAQVVIGTWENLVTPPPPDPNPLPANFHRPIGSDGTEGWIDWQNRGIYTTDTYGATNGTTSLKLLNVDDGGGPWMQSLAIPMHTAGHVASLLTSGMFAIDVSWKESDFAQGGTWSQVENLYVNSPVRGFQGLGRATTDTHNAPPWNGSWDPVNFDDNTRTLTWDMTALIDGDLSNDEIRTVPAASGGGWLELILATNYDGAANPATAAFYFDNARLLPRVVNAEWKGGAADPDDDPNNGNAAENLWYASLNWVNGVPGVADSTALLGTNGGVITTAQTVNTDRLVTLGGITFDNAAGYTIGGTGSIEMAVSTGSPSITVNAGNHAVNVPVSLAGVTNVNVASGSTLSVKQFTGAGLNIQQGTVRISPDGTSAGTSNVESLALAGGSTLDLTNNAFVVDYDGTSPLTTLFAAIQGGQITSSQGSGYAVGYAEASDFGTVPAIFGTVDGTAVLLRGTRSGDANLDGVVNLSDFNALAGNFGQSGRDWIEGDFNYDGLVNLSDFNLLAGNFGLSAGADGPTASDWAALAAAVPEPGSLGLLAAAGALTLARRRQRRA